MNCLFPSGSRSLFWGITELIIKESLDEQSDGKRRKSPLSHFPSHHSLLAVYARSHHPLLGFSLVSSSRESRVSHRSLGKPVEVAER